MKVLMINGSPNKNGCTNRALCEVHDELLRNGIESEILWIGKGAVHGCVVCGGCKATGRCVFDDDIANTISEKMAECDGLIIGSPVYYACANGALTAILNRVFGFSPNLAYKPAAAVCSARRAGTTATLDALNKYFMIRQMPVVSSTYWNMVHGSKAEDVAEDAEGLQTMRNIGKNMAWMLKCIEAGKEKGIDVPTADAGERTCFVR